MARALGASVYSMRAREIGFGPLTLTEAGRQSALKGLAETSVLHWHGDQFDIPDGARCLAQTALCPHQAFSWGDHALALQFHLEADAHRIEQWLTGHAVELSQAGVDPWALRSAARLLGDPLQKAARHVLDDWLHRVSV